MSESIKILFDSQETTESPGIDSENRVTVEVLADRAQANHRGNLRIFFAIESPDASSKIISKWEL